MVYWLDTSSLTLVRNSRSDRYDFSSLKYWIGNTFLTVNRSPACQTLSKALLTSKNIDVQYCLSSNGWCMVLMILCVCCTVECWFLNPKVVTWIRLTPSHSISLTSTVILFGHLLRFFQMLFLFRFFSLSLYMYFSSFQFMLHAPHPVFDGSLRLFAVFLWAHNWTIENQMNPAKVLKVFFCYISWNLVPSALRPNWSLQCKIWDFHGDDYEECRFLGYKNPVRTSQDPHYASAVEPNRLTLCKI
jgi:hypothetical protein